MNAIVEGDSTTNKTNAEKESNQVSSQLATRKIDPSGNRILNSSWTFWFDRKVKGKNVNYEENLSNLGSFDSIQDFWGFYTRLAKIPQIPKESNYHLFREGVIPMWETFPKGGCFIKKLKKTDDNTLTRLWEELIIATIGEQFEDPDVVGIVLSIRPKEDVISIWNKDNHNYALRTKLGDVLKNVWGAEYYSGIEYKNHSVSIRDRSTYRLKSTNSAMSENTALEPAKEENLQVDDQNSIKVGSEAK